MCTRVRHNWWVIISSNFLALRSPPIGTSNLPRAGVSKKFPKCLPSVQRYFEVLACYSFDVGSLRGAVVEASARRTVASQDRNDIASLSSCILFYNFIRVAENSRWKVPRNDLQTVHAFRNSREKLDCLLSDFDRDILDSAPKNCRSPTRYPASFHRLYNFCTKSTKIEKHIMHAGSFTRYTLLTVIAGSASHVKSLFSLENGKSARKRAWSRDQVLSDVDTLIRSHRYTRELFVI